MGRIGLVLVVVLAAMLSIAGAATAAPPSAAPLSSSAGSSPWSIQRSPNVNQATGALQHDSCLANKTFCMAVGSSVGTTGQTTPLVEVATTTGWALHSAPAPGGQSGDLTGVSCLPGFCETIGDFQNSAGSHPFAATWNGSGWSLQSIPAPAGARAGLSSVSCTSKTSCEAVGSYSTTGPGNVITENPLAEHYNGASWSIQTVPTPAGTTNDSLQDVSCPSATSCEAVGSGFASSSYAPFAAAFNGSTWTDQTAAGSGQLTGVSCWAAGACEAIGDYTDQQGDPHVTAQRLTASKWQSQSVPAPPTFDLLGNGSISCTGTSMCEVADTAVSIGGPGSVPDVPFAMGWNGTAWHLQTVSTQFDNGNLNGVSCSTSSVCRAVGMTGFATDTARAVAANWNGTKWSPAVAANPVTRPQSSLNAVSCVATACTAVGQDQSGDGLNHTLAERSIGKGWGIQKTANPGYDGSAPSPGSVLTAVSCATATACMSVGTTDADLPLSESWSAGTWSLKPVPVPPSYQTQLAGVSCTASNDCWASGSFDDKTDGGTDPLVEHWNGTSWHDTVLPLPAGAEGASLSGISCQASDCTAIGTYYDSTTTHPLAERWTGTAWASQTIHGSPYLRWISCPSTNWCDAVGDNSIQGEAEHWNGTTWTVDPMPKIPGTINISGISCVSSTSCHAVGYDVASNNSPWETLAEVWNGTAWAVQSTPNRAVSSNDRNQLDGVSCLTSGCTAAGTYAHALAPTTLIETGG